MKQYLSHGGGVNSTALMLLLEKQGVEFESIFVDHGGDYPHTYEYVKYLQENGYPITVLTPFVEGCSTIEEYCLKKGMKPLRIMRWCTSKFKLRIMRDYVQSPSIMYIGIDSGEKHRAYKKPVKVGIENKYPLADRGINRERCEEIIERSGLAIPDKSCCWMCPFASKLEIEEMRRYDPELYARREKIIMNARIAYAQKKNHILTNFVEVEA